MVSLCTIITLLGICQMQSIFVNAKLYGFERSDTDSERNSPSEAFSSRDPLGSNYYNGASDDDHANKSSISGSLDKAEGLVFIKSLKPQRKEWKKDRLDEEMVENEVTTKSEQSSSKLSVPLLPSGTCERSDAYFSGGSGSTQQV